MGNTASNSGVTHVVSHWRETCKSAHWVGQAPMPESLSQMKQSLRSPILVLDEHPHVRHLVSQFLHGHGYEPLEAGSVKEATSVTSETSIGAVVLDFSEGSASGLTRLTELRTEPRFATTPAVVITQGALGEPEQRIVTDLRAFSFHKPEGLAALIGFLDQLRTIEA